MFGEGIAPGAGDNDVIVHGDVEFSEESLEFLRKEAVRLRRSGVAPWMIVAQDDGCRPVL